MTTHPDQAISPTPLPSSPVPGHRMVHHPATLCPHVPPDPAPPLRPPRLPCPYCGVLQEEATHCTALYLMTPPPPPHLFPSRFPSSDHQMVHQLLGVYIALQPCLRAAALRSCPAWAIEELQQQKERGKGGMKALDIPTGSGAQGKCCCP